MPKVKVVGGKEPGYRESHVVTYYDRPSILYILINPQIYLGIDTISLPILEIRKLRIREVNPFAKNHITPLTSVKTTGQSGPG